MFHHSNSTYLSTRLLLSVCVALTTLPGLYGCNNQANKEEGKPPVSSGSFSPRPAKLPTLNLPPQTNLSAPKSNQPVQGTPKSQPTNPLGTSPTTSKVPPSTIEIPSSLAKKTSPTAATVPAQPPNAVPAPSPIPSGISQPAPPDIPAANIPTQNIPAQNIPTAKAPSAPPAADSPAGLTEEGQAIQQLNQPIDPNLRLTSPSASTSKASTAPKPLTSSFDTRPSSGTNSAGSSSTPSSSSSNPSGLSPLEYKYNPSTGTYSTGTAE